MCATPEVFHLQNTAIPNLNVLRNLSLNLVMGKVYECLCLFQRIFNLYFLNHLL